MRVLLNNLLSNKKKAFSYGKIKLDNPKANKKERLEELHKFLDSTQ